MSAPNPEPNPEHVCLLSGDCVESLRVLPDASIDAVVTDPPYGLSKQPDMVEVLTAWINGDDYEHRGSGFMGKSWDSFVPGPAVWREVFRVLKPGGHILVFSGTRTYDLTVLAIRLAGFEIRDQLAWLYGTGFPKSLNLEKKGGPAGRGTALKPAQEPIVLARKPLTGTVAANVLEHGTGGINVDGCRVGSDPSGWQGAPGGGGTWNDTNCGLGKAGAPTGSTGRFPANVILDEAAAALLDEQADASRFFYVAKANKKEREAGLEAFRQVSAGELTGGRAEGSAGLDNPRAGAGRTSSGRANTHPTVKPIDLMRYLCRLITPPGGVVLDPFMGSGSTGCAARMESFDFVGCELDPEYLKIAAARIAHHDQ